MKRLESEHWLAMNAILYLLYMLVGLWIAGFAGNRWLGSGITFGASAYFVGWWMRNAQERYHEAKH